MPVVALGQGARATLTMTASLDTRTSLRVSSSQVRFELVDGTPPAPVFVEFTVAARVRANTDVVLTVEAVGRLEGPSENTSTSEDVVLWFQGEGARAGTLTEGVPHVAGAWKGSGVRRGRVAFGLRGTLAAGEYLQALHFVVSTP
jgi:hypothetical protein